MSLLQTWRQIDITSILLKLEDRGIKVLNFKSSIMLYPAFNTCLIS